jgi:hypothetical protein
VDEPRVPIMGFGFDISFGGGDAGDTGLQDYHQ